MRKGIYKGNESDNKNSKTTVPKNLEQNKKSS